MSLNSSLINLIHIEGRDTIFHKLSHILSLRLLQESKMWDILNNELKFTINQTNGGHSDSVGLLTVLENGFLASGSADSTIKIWE